MRIIVVGLGGTIAMTGHRNGGVAPTLSASELVEAVPGLSEAGIELDVRSFRNRPGAALTLGDLGELLSLLRESFAAGAAGAVVTQGTDTIEETAYALSLLHTGDEPIVVTGAMRNPTLAGADGPANLSAAVRVAADPGARGLGCLVVLADEIHAADRVRKTHTTSVATFASPNGGPLGYLAEGRAHLLNRPARRYTLPGESLAAPARGTRLPAVPTADDGPLAAPARVTLYTATLGDDGSLLPLLAERSDGLVIAALGVGHVPESWVPHLEAAARRIPVVLASRTGGGRVATSTYGYPGAERDLIARGLIPAGFLDPYKARLLLQILLTAGHPDIPGAFAHS
ncbi:L-asparaginase [Actinoplanes campanulatus]|uniref:L-asparaginase n=1 Tax=Actinoplanes campanulatus TaxID=113559 RepID=A0A7W5ASM6_9ACTN|nr:asparaginase [Actinoplanes campanulatus]MBB3101279.1 L-asparaginase [Actinoplanes campanulatus]GGN50770.1 L-asparaginase [Actinoplanes campanulatus]GID42162.1 L-asparaginase [Actinoplanes campanulatus]